MSRPRGSLARRGAAATSANAAPLFSALGDRTRLRLLARLCEAGPQSTLRLVEGGRISRQAVTKHLQAMEGAGLVRGARSGRERIWEARIERLSQARDYLGEIAARWDQALQRLRVLVEDPP